MENMQSQENHQQTSEISPFDEIRDMDRKKAINILIQAAELAQKSGALTIRDSILLGAAIEFITSTPK